MADGIFTEDELTAEQTNAQTPPPEETPEQKAERERDEQGRFKAKEADPGEAEAEAKEKGGTVPQQALHAEREKRKTAEAELGKIREQLDALAKMREQVASRKPEDAPAPNDADPNGAEYLRKKVAELETGLTSVTKHIDTAAINNAEIQQLGSVMAQSEAAYRQEKPDYDEAIGHVVQARAQELSLYGLTPPQIAHTISEEATEIVRSAIAQGRNPAELGYQIALSRGYRPKEGESKPSGADTSPAQRTLDAIAEAKKQGKSLGSGGGGKAATLNAEAVIAMSPEEFAAVYSTPEGRAMIDSL